MSPPAAVTARRAQSQSPAVALTSCRAASPGCWQRRVNSSTRTRSHVRQIESSQPRPQFGQVLRRRRSQILPQTQARRWRSRQCSRRWRVAGGGSSSVCRSMRPTPHSGRGAGFPPCRRGPHLAGSGFARDRLPRAGETVAARHVIEHRTGADSRRRPRRARDGSGPGLRTRSRTGDRGRRGA